MLAAITLTDALTSAFSVIEQVVTFVTANAITMAAWALCLVPAGVHAFKSLRK